MRVEVIKSSDFTVVDNSILRDDTISLKARGMHVTLMSLPPNWNYSIRGFAAILPDGETSIRTALIELENKEYLIRGRQKVTEDGRFGGGMYYILDRPLHKMDPEVLPEELVALLPTQGFPTPDFPTSLSPSSANEGQYNTKESNNKVLITNHKSGSSKGNSAKAEKGYTEIWNNITPEDFRVISELYEDPYKLISSVDKYVRTRERTVNGPVRNYVLGYAKKSKWPTKPESDPLLME